MLKKGVPGNDEVILLEINIEYHINSIKEKFQEMEDLAKGMNTNDIKNKIDEFENSGGEIIQLLDKVSELNINEEAINMTIKRRLNHFLEDMVNTIKNPSK